MTETNRHRFNIAWNGTTTVNEEMRGMPKVIPVARFQALSQHSPGGTEGKHEHPLSISGFRAEN
jgi:hypothetical protein